MKNSYFPKINVLYVENESKYRDGFSRELFKRNIYVECAGSLEEAKRIIKSTDVDIVVSDGMFPEKKGIEESKNFIPLVDYIRSQNKNIHVIAWANSTHVHEFCKKESIQSFSKMQLSEDDFKKKGREYIQVKTMDFSEMAEYTEQKLWDIFGFSRLVSSLKLKEYYSEPATILAIYMAADMRTKLFKDTAGINYGPIITKITNGLFTLYMDESDENNVSKNIYKKIYEEGFFPNIKKNIDSRAKKLIKFSRKLRTTDYNKLSNKNLAKKYLEFTKLFMEMRMFSSLPTAMEHATNPWTELLVDILSKKMVDRQDINKNLSILTSPEKTSYLNEFQIEAAKLGILEENGKNIDKKVEYLAKKFAWIHYSFEGVPISKQDVTKSIGEIRKSSADLKKYVQEFKERAEYLRNEKKKIIKKIKLNSKEVKLFEVGADIVYIKYFRKGIFAESYYSVEFLLKEIGNRIGATTKEVVNMFSNEVLASLELGSFPKDIIRERMRNSSIWSEGGSSYPLGYQAYDAYNKVIAKDELSNDIKGQAAYIGKTSGVVKIVNTPDDMKKMKDGEILVSRSTNPSLISAMQRARAFITDIGGLTCHAAIIAREMKKPCIVGTKIATKVLKDGDEVEVDADKGVVKVIKKS